MDKFDLWNNRICSMVFGFALGLVVAFLGINYGWRTNLNKKLIFEN